MEDFIYKIKEFDNCITGAFFFVDVFSDGRMILMYKYPTMTPKVLSVFDKLEDFMAVNPKEFLFDHGFIQVKDK